MAVANRRGWEDWALESQTLHCTLHCTASQSLSSDSISSLRKWEQYLNCVLFCFRRFQWLNGYKLAQGLSYVWCSKICHFIMISRNPRRSLILLLPHISLKFPIQDGRGLRRGDHLPPHKYIKNTPTCETTPTEHLLNAGRRPQTSQKARNSPRTWVR